MGIARLLEAMDRDEDRKRRARRCWIAALLLMLLALLGAATLAQGLPIDVPSTGADRAGELVLLPLAVPKALNALNAAGLEVVDTAGVPVPLQLRALSRWGGKPEDGSAPIRWVQLAFIGGAPADRAGRYFVRYGPARPGSILRRVTDGEIELSAGGRTWTWRSGELGPVGLECRGTNGLPLAVTVNAPTLEIDGSVYSVVLQRGTIGGLRFTARWQVVHGRPELQLDFRVENPGTFGPPDAGTDQAIHFASLALTLPDSGAGVPLEVRSASAAERPVGALQGSDVTVAVDRFWQNFPKALLSANGSMRVELWPESGSGPLFGGQWWDPAHVPLGTDALARTHYRFEGGRWKTHRVLFDFGAGDAAAAAHRIEHPLIALPPTWWTPATAALGQLIGTRGAGSLEIDRFERMLDVLAKDAAADNQPTLGQIGLPAFRLRGGTYAGQGPEMFGWANFGDIAWGDGYSSLHYALDWDVLVNFVRSGDRAFLDVGRELVAHRRDYDQVHSTASPRRGGQFYEKGYSHGNAYAPQTSHIWVQGMCLWYLLTGDEGTREALLEAGDYLLRSRPDTWDGWWGSRILGWQVEALVHLWNTLGDPRHLAMAQAALGKWLVLEAGTGRVHNLGSLNIIPGAPVNEQSWMHAIVMSAFGKLWIASGDPRIPPLLTRMSNWLMARAIAPAEAGRSAFVWTYVADAWRDQPNTHHCWGVSDALAYAAIATGNRGYLAESQRLWESVARWHQNGAGAAAGALSPIAFRMMQYPNSETKIMSNIALWGHAYPAARVLMGQ